MNNDLISRSALLEQIANHSIFKTTRVISRERRYGFEITKADMYGYVVNAPAVDAEPVRHGQWIPYKQNVECSECHVKWAIDESIAVVYTSIKDLKYCPNCGARMDGDVNA